MCNGDLAARPAELEAIKSELNNKNDAMINSNFQDRMLHEEQALDEELDTLRGQLRQEKTLQPPGEQGPPTQSAQAAAEASDN